MFQGPCDVKGRMQQGNTTLRVQPGNNIHRLPPITRISSSASRGYDTHGSLRLTEIRSVLDEWRPRVFQKQSEMRHLCLRVFAQTNTPQKKKTLKRFSGKVKVHAVHEELISSNGASGCFLGLRVQQFFRFSSDCVLLSGEPPSLRI